MLISDYLDICDPVLTFDKFMEEIDLEKYLKVIPRHYTGRLRYNPVSMLKTVLFGFMTNGYISLRELEDQCRVNLRFIWHYIQQQMYLHTPVWLIIIIRFRLWIMLLMVWQILPVIRMVTDLNAHRKQHQ